MSKIIYDFIKYFSIHPKQENEKHLLLSLKDVPTSTKYLNKKIPKDDVSFLKVKHI